MFNNQSGRPVTSNPDYVQKIIDADGTAPKNVMLSQFVKVSDFKEMQDAFNNLKLEDEKLRTELQKSINKQTIWFIGSIFTLAGLIIAAMKFIFHL